MTQLSDYDKIAQAFEIFRNFSNHKDHSVSAQHDVIYAGPDPVDVPDEYKEKLAALGWHPSEHDCFEYFT